MPNTPEKKAREAEQARIRRQNPEVRARHRAASRKYYQKNRAKQLARGRKYRAKPEIRARNNANQRNRQRNQRQDPNFRNKTREYNAERRRSRRVSLAGRPRPDVCDACGKKDERGVVFDHCHQKGHFRGWLCNNCNWVLGHVRDNPGILLKLAAYLKRTSNGVSRQMSLPGI